MTSTAIVIRDEQHEILRAQVRERSIAPLEGEKRLMLAVLERAVDDLRTYANVPTGRGRWLFTEVAAWFDSSETGPFDFRGHLPGDWAGSRLHQEGAVWRARLTDMVARRANGNHPSGIASIRRTFDARSCHYTTEDHSAGAREIWREATSDRADG